MPTVKGTNYYEKEIAGFVMAKTAEAAGARKTPRKGVTDSTRYKFIIDGKEGKEGVVCEKFLYGHYIDAEGRVRLRSDCDGDDKITLANDSSVDHELAKTTLLQWLALPGTAGQQVLKVIKDCAPTAAKKTQKLKITIRKALSTLFDVGGKFIDCSPHAWDIAKFRLTALAYDNVLGDGRQTLASQKLVLERHEEMLKTVLHQRWTSQQDMEAFMRQTNERAAMLDTKAPNAQAVATPRRLARNDCLHNDHNIVATALPVDGEQHYKTLYDRAVETICKKDRLIAEKERVILEKERVISGKERMISKRDDFIQNQHSAVSKVTERVLDTVDGMTSVLGTQAEATNQSVMATNQSVMTTNTLLAESADDLLVSNGTCEEHDAYDSC